MFAPRPSRNVSTTSLGVYARATSRRSRSTKTVAPWVGYCGVLGIRASSAPTRSRIAAMRTDLAARARNFQPLALATRRPPLYGAAVTAAGYRGDLHVHPLMDESL